MTEILHRNKKRNKHDCIQTVGYATCAATKVVRQVEQVHVSVGFSPKLISSDFYPKIQSNHDFQNILTPNTRNLKYK